MSALSCRVNVSKMEQPPEDISKFSIVRQHRRMLANMGFFINSKSRILDFGCGSGNYVYEYHDNGFEAYGFDITSYVQLRKPEDEQYFRFSLVEQPANIPEYSTNKHTYKIPFEDDSFDFVFSTSVFEHVIDHDLALSEMARIMKPGGAAIHTFPARYVPIEPHINVPFAGAIQAFPWFLLWSLLGIRNQFQDHLGPLGRAKINYHYARTGLNYLNTEQILQISRQYFQQVRLIPELWEMGDYGYISSKGRRTIIHRFFRWLYNNCDTVVLFLRK
jgi:SAM-dependent methyltransferase